MRTYLFLVLIAWTSGLCAADLIKDEDIPDPFGLGPRLALIDLLKEEYGAKPEPGASLLKLKQLYATFQPKTGPQRSPEDQKRYDELVAALAELKVEINPDDTLVTLEAALKHHQAEQERLENEVRDTKWGDVGNTRLTSLKATRFELGNTPVRITLPHGFREMPHEILARRFKPTLHARVAYGNPSDLYLVSFVAVKHRQPYRGKDPRNLEKDFREYITSVASGQSTGEWRKISGRQYYAQQFETELVGHTITNHLFATLEGGHMYMFLFNGLTNRVAAKSGAIYDSINTLVFLDHEGKVKEPSDNMAIPR